MGLMETQVPAPAPDFELPKAQLEPPVTPSATLAKLAALGRQENRGQKAKDGLNPFWLKSTGPKVGSQHVKSQITHAAIIDMMLARPTATRQEIADAFGFKSVQTITVIVNSDAFQAALAKRSKEIVNPVLTACLEDRLRAIASRSADIVHEALEREPTNTKLALETLKVTRAGEYGAKSAVAVQTNFVVALPGPASSSEEWMTRFAPAEGTVLRPRLEDAPTEVQIKD